MKSCYKSFENLVTSYNKILYEYDTCIICYIWDKQDSDYKIVEIIFFWYLNYLNVDKLLGESGLCTQYC